MAYALKLTGQLQDASHIARLLTELDQYHQQQGLLAKLQPTTAKLFVQICLARVKNDRTALAYAIVKRLL